MAKGNYLFDDRAPTPEWPRIRAYSKPRCVRSVGPRLSTRMLGIGCRVYDSRMRSLNNHRRESAMKSSVHGHVDQVPLDAARTVKPDGTLEHSTLLTAEEAAATRGRPQPN